MFDSLSVDWDSAVSIVTHCEVDSLGMESQLGQEFLHPFRLVLGPSQPLVQSVCGIFPGGKVARAWH